MEVIDAAATRSDATALQHRGAGLSFKDLFKGDADDIPNNYYFVVATQHGFYSPVHKHNFDQFRFPLKGDISITADLTVRQGELCYHPEGVEYGPQDDGPDERSVLVLQFGGASGQGFISHAHLKEAQLRMNDRGKFEKGRFINHGEDESTSVDGFEATWAEKMGRPLVYPKPRYSSVINMQPGAYSWKPVLDSPGIYKKSLGIFSERETRAEIIRLEKGSTWKIESENATQLFWVLKGSGKTLDGQSLRPETAARVTAGSSETVKVESTEDLEILRFVMPIIHT